LSRIGHDEVNFPGFVPPIFRQAVESTAMVSSAREIFSPPPTVLDPKRWKHEPSTQTLNQLEKQGYYSL